MNIYEPWRAPRVLARNIFDVVRYGELMHPDRWFHDLRVPSVRANEPGEVTIMPSGLDLYGLYWGRHLKNVVHVDPGVKRWPY